MIFSYQNPNHPQAVNNQREPEDSDVKVRDFQEQFQAPLRSFGHYEPLQNPKTADEHFEHSFSQLSSHLASGNKLDAFIKR